MALAAAGGLAAGLESPCWQRALFGAAAPLPSSTPVASTSPFPLLPLGRRALQNPEQITTIFDLGKAEALSWAKEAGFLDARQERGWRGAYAAAGGRRVAPAAAAPFFKPPAATEGGPGVAGEWGVQEGRR
jgi:hypothetical protein